MEVTKKQSGDILDVRVEGRLDSYWADHLSSALEDAVRAGSHRIRIDLAGVGYMSSVGIRVLLRFYKQAQQLGGSFTVVNPADAVKRVLELSGLQTLLQAEASPPPSKAARTAERRIEHAGAAIDVFPLAADAGLACETFGNPEKLERGRFGPEDAFEISFPSTVFGVGLGAFGDTYEECRNRFGEFMAAGGTAAYLPTDGTNVSDHISCSGDLVPRVNALYALAVEGSFSRLLRFDCGDEAGGIALSDLIGAGFEVTDAPAVGAVVVAESAGMVGAALRRSPAAERDQEDLFAHPGVRSWMSFTPERAYPGSLCIAVGIATRAPNETLAPFLRPLRNDAQPAGHFHGAAFSYSPMQKGVIQLSETVARIFETQTLQCILHLLNDRRQMSGGGETEFVRGACWVGAIEHVAAGGAVR
jgi:anti-anti-sigma factor